MSLWLLGRKRPGATRAAAAAWASAIVIAAIATYNNLAHGIWIDEAFSYDTGTGPLARTFRQALHFEMQPPLYFLLLNLTLRVWPSMEFGRFLSSACVLGSVVVLYQLAKTLRLSDAAPSLPLLAALCPYVLWASSEGRPYGLLLLLTALATYLYVLLLQAENRVSRLGVLYVVVWYLTLLTFYYSGFLLVGQVAGAIAVRRGKRLVTAAAAVGLLLIPWLPTIWMQISRHPRGASLPAEEGGLRGFLSLARWAYEFALGSIFMAPLLRRPVVVAATALVLVAIVGGYWYWRGRRAVDPMLRVFLITTALPLLLILTLARGSSPHSVEPRHLGFLVVSVLILMALAADGFPDHRVGRYLGRGMLVFGAVCVLSFQRRDPAGRGWEEAAAFIEERETPGDVIFVFEPDAVLPFQYYYRGNRPVFGLPVDRSGDAYSIERHAIHSVPQVKARIESKVGASGEFWLVARSPRPAWGRALLDEYLRSRTVLMAPGPAKGPDVGRYRLLRPSGAADVADSAVRSRP